MQFGIYLVRRGLITPSEFVDVVERQLASRPPLGALAIETHKLSMHQLFEVLEAQADAPRPIGALAVELGFLQPGDVAYLLGLQSERSISIQDLVVEMGFLDADEVDRERQRYQRAASANDSRGDVATAGAPLSAAT